MKFSCLLPPPPIPPGAGIMQHTVLMIANITAAPPRYHGSADSRNECDSSHAIRDTVPVSADRLPLGTVGAAATAPVSANWLPLATAVALPSEFSCIVTNHALLPGRKKSDMSRNMYALTFCLCWIFRAPCMEQAAHGDNDDNQTMASAAAETAPSRQTCMLGMFCS